MGTDEIFIRIKNEQLCNLVKRNTMVLFLPEAHLRLVKCFCMQSCVNYVLNAIFILVVMRFKTFFNDIGTKFDT